MPSFIVPAATQQGAWKVLLFLLKHTDLAGESDVVCDVITNCGQQHKWQAALQLYASSCAKQQRVDLFCFSSIMVACNKAHQWEITCRLFIHLPLGRVAANQVVYHCAMNAGNVGKQWRVAPHLLTEMLARRIIPNERSLIRVAALV